MNHRRDWLTRNSMTSKLITSGIMNCEGIRSTTGEDKEEEDSEEIRLKYVDAPPPIINPWRINPNAATIIAKKVPISSKQEPQTMKVVGNGMMASTKSATSSLKYTPSHRHQPAYSKERGFNGSHHRTTNNGPRDQNGDGPRNIGNKFMENSVAPGKNNFEVTKATTIEDKEHDSEENINEDGPGDLINPWRIIPSNSKQKSRTMKIGNGRKFPARSSPSTPKFAPYHRLQPAFPKDMSTPTRTTKSNSSSLIFSESGSTDSHHGTTNSGPGDESGDGPRTIEDNVSESSLASGRNISEGTKSTTSEGKEEDDSEEAIKYVDAPPPVINPWRVNPSNSKQKSLTMKVANDVKVPAKAAPSTPKSVPAKFHLASSKDVAVSTPTQTSIRKGSSSIFSESGSTDSHHHGTMNGGPSNESGEGPRVVEDNGSEKSVACGSNLSEGSKSTTGEVKEDEDLEESIKYVDAPPPVINPWRINPSAASVIAKKGPFNSKQDSLTMKVGNGVKVPGQTAPSTRKSTPAKLHLATSKDAWDINRAKRKQESGNISTKVTGEGWPALETTIEEVTDNLTSVTLECKILQFDSSSMGSADSLDEELVANGKLCEEKWPLISSGDSSKNHSSARKDSSDDVLPSSVRTQSTRRQHASGDDNGSGSTSVSSDYTVAEVNREGITDEIQTRKSKKSAKLKWVPLKLPETMTPKHRVRREKSLKFKSSRYERGDSPSGSSGRGRGRGGARGRGTGRGNSRSSHQYFFNESTDPNVIPPPNPRDDYTDYPPDFTTLAPVFSEVSEFIMPYVADNYYTSSFVQQSDSTAATNSPSVSFIPVGLEDALLVELLKQQIEYYFSEENLEKDFYLRRKMDSDGYLPIKLIASFQRVQNMTHDYNIVVSAILSSEILEMKEDMSSVRTMINPTRWPIADTLYLAVSTSEYSCPVSSQVPSTNVPNGVVLSEPRSIEAV